MNYMSYTVRHDVWKFVADRVLKMTLKYNRYDTAGVFHAGLFQHFNIMAEEEIHLSVRKQVWGKVVRDTYHLTINTKGFLKVNGVIDDAKKN